MSDEDKRTLAERITGFRNEHEYVIAFGYAGIGFLIGMVVFYGAGC